MSNANRQVVEAMAEFLEKKDGKTIILAWDSTGDGTAIVCTRADLNEDRSVMLAENASDEAVCRLLYDEGGDDEDYETIFGEKPEPVSTRHMSTADRLAAQGYDRWEEVDD